MVSARRPEPSPEPTPSASVNRRSELVAAAYRLIAEHGLEGLRFADVARAVGVNNGTLVYYFGTKEGLIQAVVVHLIQQFAALQVARAPSPGDWQGKLRAEFDDVRQRLRQHPELGIVYSELLTRGQRDPAIANMLVHLDDGWHSSLQHLIAAGQADGVFRADIEPSRAASAVMAIVKGIGVYSMTPASGSRDMDTVIDDIQMLVENWLRPFSPALTSPADRSTGQRRQRPRDRGSGTS